jgi:hypothetical protein
MASEIEQLADLEGFLKFASTPYWKRVRLTPVRYPIRERPRSRRAAAAMADGAAADGPGADARVPPGPMVDAVVIDGAMAGAGAPPAVAMLTGASVAPDPVSAASTRSSRRVASTRKKNIGKKAEGATRKKAVGGEGVSAKPQGNGKDPQGGQSGAPNVSNGAAPTKSSGSGAELG